MIDLPGFASPAALANLDLPVAKRPLLRRPAACRYLKEKRGLERAPATLAKYACVGGGPRFYKAGRWPLYDPDELDRWANELIGTPVASTSEVTTLPRGNKPESTYLQRSLAPDADATPDDDHRSQPSAELT